MLHYLALPHYDAYLIGNARNAEANQIVSFCCQDVYVVLSSSFRCVDCSLSLKTLSHLIFSTPKSSHLAHFMHP
jgi:hypothetical protein